MVIFPFVESSLQAYSFNPTMDGRVVATTIVWSLFGKRYYIRMTELSGARLFLLPLIGSLEGFPILSIRWQRGKVAITTTFPHNYEIGNTMDLTIRGCAPAGYNGKFRCYIPNTQQIVYDRPQYPGQPLKFGLVNYDIDISAGYFDTSTLVYRAANRQFEVTP